MSYCTVTINPKPECSDPVDLRRSFDRELSGRGEEGTIRWPEASCNIEKSKSGSWIELDGDKAAGLPAQLPTGENIGAEGLGKGDSMLGINEGFSG